MTAAMCGVARGGDDAFTVLRMMPSDMPISIVVVDFEKLDKSLKTFAKRIGPDVTVGAPLEDVRSELRIGEWIDFSKPFGLAVTQLGDWGDVAMWGKVPDFAAKVKTIPDATETEGVWFLPSKGPEKIEGAEAGEGEGSGEGSKGPEGVEPGQAAESTAEPEGLYAVVKGDYVIGATTKAFLEKATKSKANLADEMKSRAAIFGNRDVWMHINMEPLRDKALGGLGNFSAMVPMIGMMAGAQGAGDPAMITAVFGTVLEGVESLVQQLKYVEIALKVDGKAIDATVASGYNEGPIRDYLAKQKPAGVPFFVEIEDQPYFAAFGYHLPGKDSPFLEYLASKMISAIKAQPPSVPAEEGAKPDSDTLVEAVKQAVEFYTMVEGFDGVMAMLPEGMKEAGTFITKNHAEIIDLTKQTFTDENPLMQQFGGGVKVEALGSTKIGEATVEQFAMKLDELDPASPMANPMMAAIYGEDTRYGIGVVNDRVRFCLGNEQDMKRTFSGKVSVPLASSSYVKEAMASLPKKHNAVVLLDIATAVGFFNTMMGMPAPASPVSAGPPIAVSATLSGHPALLDIHVPARAIERIKQAAAPEEPM
jgi:hypothetical protein